MKKMFDDNSRACRKCKNRMPISRLSCPHCGSPSHFPNVDCAKKEEERKKLATRFKVAFTKCRKDNCENIAIKFIEAAKQSKAVFTCPVFKLHREIASSTDVFETYYDLERLKLRTGKWQNYNWDKLRPQAEIELLGTHKNIDQIHYACLSITGKGLNYGDCLVVLSEPMIAHRSSCFEGNTAVVFANERSFESKLRSDWKSRDKICFSTCAHKLNSGTTESDFQSIMVCRGQTSLDDEFIEVHIFGSMTSKTFEAIEIDTSNHSAAEAALVSAIEESFAPRPVVRV